MDQRRIIPASELNRDAGVAECTERGNPVFTASDENPMFSIPHQQLSHDVAGADLLGMVAVQPDGIVNHRKSLERHRTERGCNGPEKENAIDLATVYSGPAFG